MFTWLITLFKNSVTTTGAMSLGTKYLFLNWMYRIYLMALTFQAIFYWTWNRIQCLQRLNSLDKTQYEDDNEGGETKNQQKLKRNVLWAFWLWLHDRYWSQSLVNRSEYKSMSWGVVTNSWRDFTKNVR